jgi:hypothetical protein
MNTSTASETTVRDIVVNVLTNTDTLPPPKDNEYRYYHCNLEWNGLKCKKVDGPSAMPTRDDSLLLFVKSYIPEQFDSQILKYKWIPNRVIIEEKST